MSRIRKEPNRYWSKEDKLKIIKEVLDGKSSYEVAKKYDMSSGMIRSCAILYTKKINKINYYKWQAVCLSYKTLFPIE